MTKNPLSPTTRADSAARQPGRAESSGGSLAKLTEIVMSVVVH